MPNRAYKLSPAKHAQRKDLLRYARRGTVLELHAGQGNVTSIYKPHARKIIQVDTDRAALRKAKERAGRTPLEQHAMDNRDYIAQLKPGQPAGLAIVDMDPYGTVGPIFREFFAKYKVKQPLVVALTDGSGTFRTFKLNSLDSKPEEWFRENYGVTGSAMTDKEMPAILDAMVNKAGERHGFKAVRLNVAKQKGNGHVIHAGYLLKPLKQAGGAP